MPNTPDWNALTDDAVKHLQALLRLNTSNPPGNETIASEYLAGVLRGAEIEAEVVGGVAGRDNVAARLRADNPTERPLMLTGHVDVVSVERDKWTHDPFGGELHRRLHLGPRRARHEEQVAGELAVMLALKRSGVALDRDIIFVAFADEEAGGEAGAAWMNANHRDLVDAEYAINEGGGTSVDFGDQRFFMVQAGEKGASRMRITARAGRSCLGAARRDRDGGARSGAGAAARVAARRRP